MDKFIIHRAAEDGHLDSLRQIIDEGVSVDSRDELDETPLHLAAERGRYEVAELLISRGCDLNLKDCAGRTPVLCAAAMGKRDCVGLLLQRGAQVNCTDKIKQTLLHIVSEKGWTDIAQSILDRKEIDPNAATIGRDTPLHKAVSMGRVGVASLLLQAGAKVNQRDDIGNTPLHRAAEKSQTRVIQVLLEQKGLDLNPQNVYGDTPLHNALNFTFHGTDLVEQLLVAGSSPTLKNKNGETALSRGIKQGTLTLKEIRLFVQHGAFLQECDYERIFRKTVLKESVLKDVSLCTQSIVNKFHLQTLPALGSIRYFARNHPIPNIDNFKLNAQQINDVENLVKLEIERNSFCNVIQFRPMALSALCVLSLIACQSRFKRSASSALYKHSKSKKRA